MSRICGPVVPCGRCTRPWVAAAIASLRLLKQRRLGRLAPNRATQWGPVAGVASPGRLRDRSIPAKRVTIAARRSRRPERLGVRRLRRRLMTTASKPATAFFTATSLGLGADDTVLHL